MGVDGLVAALLRGPARRWGGERCGEEGSEVRGVERLRAQSGDSRTLRPRLPCWAGAESFVSSHWATGKSSRTWSRAGGARRSGEERGPGPGPEVWGLNRLGGW